MPLGGFPLVKSDGFELFRLLVSLLPVPYASYEA